MKNIKFFLLSLIAVTLLFSACSDLSKDTSGNQKKSQYTVLGSLSLAGVSRAVYSRTATTAFSDEPVWTISATKGEKSYLPNEVSDLAFNFTFDEAGEYLIEATALKAGKIIAQGSCLCMVSADKENFASIIAKPVASILPGSVNLEINLDSYSANKVSSVQVEWLGFVNIDRTKQALGYPSGAELTGDAKEPEISEEVQAAIAALIDWEEQRSEGVFNTTLPVESGKAVIEMDNIFCGAHTVKLSFSDSVGNTLYSCKEILNVYSGFTTNEWYGTAPYLNNGTFTLTSTLVEKYGTELVPNTQLVLYEYYTNNTDSGYKYYLADSASASLATADLTNNEPSQNGFCFDKNGNVYALMYNTDESRLFLISNRSGFVSSNTGRPIGSTLFMAIDREMDTLWLLADQELSLYGFKKISEQSSLPDNQSDLRSAYTSSNYFYDPEGANYSPKAIAAGNGFLYLAGIKFFSTNSGGSYKVLVTKTDVVSDVVDDGSNKELHCYNTKATDFSDFNFTSSATINDMLYQNGSVYILISENDVDLSMNPSDPDNHPEISDILKGNIINRGTVVKYDTITGAFSYITSEKEYVSLEKLHVLGRQSGGSDYRLYLDTDKTPLMYNISEHSGSYADVYAYLSSDLTAKVLHSPQKFIAIKPKKLVIADDGVAYYIDSAKGLRYKNENRVVEIDLETFAISKVEPASVAFGEDESGDNVFSFTVNSVFSSETTYYGGDPIGELSGIGNFFPGILSEDD